jgi:hypothetical protein
VAGVLFDDNRGYPDLVRLEAELDRGLELLAADAADDLGWNVLDEVSVGMEQSVLAAHALHHLLVRLAGVDRRSLASSPEYRQALDLAAGLAGNAQALDGAPSFDRVVASVVVDRVT